MKRVVSWENTRQLTRLTHTKHCTSFEWIVLTCVISNTHSRRCLNRAGAWRVKCKLYMRALRHSEIVTVVMWLLLCVNRWSAAGDNWWCRFFVEHSSSTCILAKVRDFFLSDAIWSLLLNAAGPSLCNRRLINLHTPLYTAVYLYVMALVAFLDVWPEKLTKQRLRIQYLWRDSN